MFVSTTSLSLAYNELSIDSKKRDEKMKNLDPKKKEQMERLGMGGSGARQVTSLAVYLLLLERAI